MSVEHMRTAATLARNIEMSYAVECGAPLQDVASQYKVRPSSVRSSVKRTRGHVMKFITKFPQELDGTDARRNAYKAFAKHVGASVSLARKTNKVGAQCDLF